MRASEFITEVNIGSALSGLAVGAGNILKKATGKLGAGGANLASRLGKGAINAAGKLGGGIENAGEKAATTLAAKAGLSKTGQTMAGVIGKGAGSYVKNKVAQPPQPGTTPADQPVVKKGDKIDNLDVTNVSGTDVEIKAPKEMGLGDKATIKLPKKELGVR